MKNVLVIGGSSGIGAAICNKLSEDHNVYATYNTNSKDSTGNINYFKYNTTDETLDQSSLPEVLDGFVYCPGGINLLPFGRIKTSVLLEDFNTQVLGAINCLQSVLPKLKNSEMSSVVFFSTVAVQSGFNFHAQVAVCKGAIEGLTKSLAAEFSPKIRVNAIAPSLTDTPLASKLLNTPEKIEANAQRHPLKRIGSAEDIAEIASFLLSSNSSWITGQIIHVDGGMSSLKI